MPPPQRSTRSPLADRREGARAARRVGAGGGPSGQPERHDVDQRAQRRVARGTPPARSARASAIPPIQRSRWRSFAHRTRSAAAHMRERARDDPPRGSAAARRAPARRRPRAPRRRSGCRGPRRAGAGQPREPLEHDGRQLLRDHDVVLAGRRQRAPRRPPSPPRQPSRASGGRARRRRGERHVAGGARARARARARGSPGRPCASPTGSGETTSTEASSRAAPPACAGRPRRAPTARRRTRRTPSGTVSAERALAQRPDRAAMTRPRRARSRRSPGIAGCRRRVAGAPATSPPREQQRLAWRARPPPPRSRRGGDERDVQREVDGQRDEREPQGARADGRRRSARSRSSPDR